MATKLAERLTAPLGVDQLDYLRALTLTNVAAGVGEKGAVGRLISSARAPLGGTSGADAFVLGMGLHARTQDDFFPAGRAHVGAVTLASALALAEDVGDRLLPSLASGYQAMIAIAGCYGAEAQRRRYRPTGFFGPFGSAGVAAAALELDAAATTSALGLVCAMTSGTNQAWIAGTDEWLIEVGAAARAGVESVQLVTAGARSAADAFEGESGWSAAFFGDHEARLLLESLRSDSTLSASIATKPYPISGIAQVPTWLAIQAHAALNGRRPTAVKVEMSTAELDYPGSSNRGPFTGRAQALMSVSHCVGCALAAGTISLRHLEQDAPITDLTAIELRADPALKDSESRLSLQVDGRTMEFSGSGRQLLHPTWSSIDPDEVAHRSEADPLPVRAAHAELSKPNPDARMLRAILMETVR